MLSKQSIKIISGLLVGILIVVSSTFIFKKSGQVKQAGKTLRINIYARPQSLDPHEVDDTYTAKLLAQMYESPLEYRFVDENTAPILQPNLLAKFPEISKDRRQYTLTFKKNIFYEDDDCFIETNGKGRELTAYDAEYCWTRIFDPKLTSPYMSTVKCIKGARAFHKGKAKSVEGIKVIDRYTLRITLEEEDATFLGTLAQPVMCVFPKEAPDYYKEKFKSHVVGTGPFTMSKALTSRTNMFVLKRRADYHGVPAKIEELHISVISEPSAMWLKFKNKELDIASRNEVEIYKNNLVRGEDGKLEVSEELKGLGVDVQPAKNTGMIFLFLNLRSKALKKLKVRQAIALAIDLQEIIRVVHNNYASLAHGVLLPGFENQGFDPNYKAPYTTKHDVKKAKGLLAEAGHADGQGIDALTMYIFSGISRYKKMALCMQKDLAEIGIKLNIVSMPFHDINTKIKDPHSTAWDLSFMGWSIDTPDMNCFFQLFYAGNIGSTNYSGYNNPIFNKRFEDASKMEMGREKRMLYQLMDRQIAHDVPAIPICRKESYDFFSKRVKNLHPRYEFITNQEKYIDIVDA